MSKNLNSKEYSPPNFNFNLAVAIHQVLNHRVVVMDNPYGGVVGVSPVVDDEGRVNFIVTVKLVNEDTVKRRIIVEDL